MLRLPNYDIHLVSDTRANRVLHSVHGGRLEEKMTFRQPLIECRDPYTLVSKTTDAYNNSFIWHMTFCKRYDILSSITAHNRNTERKERCKLFQELTFYGGIKKCLLKV